MHIFDSHAHFDDARFDALEATEGNGLFDRRFRHCEGVVTALHVVVGEDRAAYDRQVGIRA